MTPPHTPFEVVTLDLDGTLLPGTTAFEAILRAHGKSDFVAQSDARFFSGQISLEACFWEQWGEVARLSPQAISRALGRAPWLPGIEAGVADLRAAGIGHVAILTDQPDLAADFAARWGLDAAICSPVATEDGVIVDIDARFDKWANLRTRLQSWGIEPAAVCHVGNGANDAEVWQQVGAGVAVFAEPDVASQATVDVGQPANFGAIRDAILQLHGV